MSYYLYILQSSSTNRHYIGHTQQLSERLHRHNTNRVPSTRRKGPWSLVYQEEFKTREDAAKRETYLKSLKDRTVIKQLVRTSR